MARVVKKPHPEPGYSVDILDLSQEEAETLLLVVGACGGSPTNRHRRNTDKIFDLMSEAGVRRLYNTPERAYTGTLLFREDK